MTAAVSARRTHQINLWRFTPGFIYLHLEKQIPHSHWQAVSILSNRPISSQTLFIIQITRIFVCGSFFCWCVFHLPPAPPSPPRAGSLAPPAPHGAGVEGARHRQRCVPGGEPVGQPGGQVHCGHHQGIRCALVHGVASKGTSQGQTMLPIFTLSSFE